MYIVIGLNLHDFFLDVNEYTKKANIRGAD
jgi:hypothetical protein